MTTYWHAEGLDLDDDPASGAAITRLTARPLTNIDIYCDIFRAFGDRPA